VVGGEGTVGVTYFLTRSLFLDVAYAYSKTANQTFDYSSTFTNTRSPFGTTSGTLVGSSSGEVVTQGVTFTVNMAFDFAP
jgi:opacity protein-like surface antigen